MTQTQFHHSPALVGTKSPSICRGIWGWGSGQGCGASHRRQTTDGQTHSKSRLLEAVGGPGVLTLACLSESSRK